MYPYQVTRGQQDGGESMKSENLWVQVANGCLRHAIGIVSQEKLSNADVEHIYKLTKTAIEMDKLNLQWEQQNQSSSFLFGDFHV